MTHEAQAFGHAPMVFGEDNKLSRGIIVRCPCGTEERLPYNTHARPATSERDQDAVEIQFVRRRLVPRGWFIGRVRREHRCPKCNALRTTSQQMPKPTMPEKMPVEAAAPSLAQQIAPEINLIKLLAERIAKQMKKKVT
ncbi:MULTISPECIES: hypothetical protein [Bradyrhizobium]|uniref:hypothetical protein n=1 Tax=Bradyrhizobium TaxID=374 RepID=UPI00041B0DB0|nr:MULTISPECIES: hypothetical protein [Bradyrhizobium]WLB92423.1 hypothetical protein QIH91_20195 [Bradyrhizobium japonicum USDA 135]